jgi:hypothetical protein
MIKSNLFSRSYKSYRDYELKRNFERATERSRICACYYLSDWLKGLCVSQTVGQGPESPTGAL